jgi:GTPase SAR1 family protein
MQVQFTAWDLGGHEQVRDLWEEYYAGADAIVFMVDSADKSRLPEAKRELGDLLKHEAVDGELAFNRRCTTSLQVLIRLLCAQGCRC